VGTPKKGLERRGPAELHEKRTRSTKRVVRSMAAHQMNIFTSQLTQPGKARMLASHSSVGKMGTGAEITVQNCEEKKIKVGKKTAWGGFRVGLVSPKKTAPRKRSMMEKTAVLRERGLPGRLIVKVSVRGEKESMAPTRGHVGNQKKKLISESGYIGQGRRWRRYRITKNGVIKRKSSQNLPE